MATTNQPASEPVRPAIPLRLALQEHRQAVAASTQALQCWTAAADAEDRALRKRLEEIRRRLSTALQDPAPRRHSSPKRSRFRIVGVSDE